MISIIFDVIANTASIKLTNGAETGAGRSVIAIPTIRAKNIMCSIFGFSPAIELNTFFGTMVLTTDIKAVSFSTALVALSTLDFAPLENFACNCAPIAGSMRSPGRIVFASVRPMMTEIAERIERVNKRFQTDATEFANVADARHSDHQGRKNERHDDHQKQI